MIDKITNPPSQKELIDKVNELVDDKQDTLVSGTNIKTINGNSILGTGDLTTGKVLDYYGTCTTAAATRAKVVTCSGFVLETGVSIRVKFTYAQTYNGAPTLNVNSTGAKSVKSIGTTNAVRYCWNAGEVVSFTYDGTNWIMEDAGIASASYYGYTMLANAESVSSNIALAPVVLFQYNMNTVSGYFNYDTSSTYSVGDRVRYEYKNWECIEEITTPESWKQGHWRALPTLQAQIDGKQDTLVSGTNIKTINNTSILGSGNIDIQGGSSYTAGTGIDITNDVISVTSAISTGAALGATALQPSALNGYATESWVTQQGYITSITSSDVTTALGYTPYNSSNPSGYITSAALTGYEQTSNKVTSISSSSTDAQYPSAKCVYDIVGDIETALHTINSGGINAGGSGGSTN